MTSCRAIHVISLIALFVIGINGCATPSGRPDHLVGQQPPPPVEPPVEPTGAAPLAFAAPGATPIRLPDAGPQPGDFHGVVPASALGNNDTDSGATTGHAEVHVAVLDEPESVPEELVDAGPPGETLTLSDILYLADQQNPRVALARERIEEAYARLARAESIWLPSLRAGANYNHHEGAIQDVRGTVFQTTRSSFYAGFGASAVGAGSPVVPGLIAQFHVADVIFQPRVAGHQAASREFGAVAVRNDVLRDAAVAYLELVRAEQGVSVADEALENTERLAQLTGQYARSGQGLVADAQRMEAELAIRQDQLLSQQEQVAVAAARLGQVLHAEPGLPIASGESSIVPLELMDIDGSTAELVALGLTMRPELCEYRHLIWGAVERLRRERYAPLIPSVLLATSYGNHGGGLGSSLADGDRRWDADAVAYWELRNLGLGDRAARMEAASHVRQAEFQQVAVLDRIAREVTEAHARVLQRQQRIEIAKKGIQAAEKSYTLNLQRIENAQGLPIEVLQAIQSLAAARRAYLDAVIDFNIAQFELCHATGWFAEIQP